jgi:hypothetical protein
MKAMRDDLAPAQEERRAELMRRHLQAKEA